MLQVIAPIPPQGPILIQRGSPLPPEAIVIIVIAICATVAAVAIGLPIVRAWARRQDRRALQTGSSPEVLERLDRIERAIEVIAVEVERVSEGQRFANRMIAERSREPIPLQPPGGGGSRRDT